MPDGSSSPETALEMFNVKLDINPAKVAREMRAIHHLPRNNEQAILLQLIYEDNILSLPSSVDSNGKISNGWNRPDVQVLTDPYSGLLGLWDTSDLLRRNTEVANMSEREKEELHALAYKGQSDIVSDIRSKQKAEIQAKIKTQGTQNGSYVTVNQKVSPQTGHSSPRLCFSLDPREQVGVSRKLLESIVEYLPRKPDFYAQYKFYNSEPFGYGEDLHIYFDPAQESNVYEFLTTHLHPRIKGDLLHGGRPLMLPIHDRNMRLMNGVQFGRALPGMATSGTIRTLQNIFTSNYEAYRGRFPESLMARLKQGGYPAIKDDPYYRSALRTSSKQVSENGRMTEKNNILVPANFALTYPTFHKATRFKEMTPALE